MGSISRLLTRIDLYLFHFSQYRYNAIKYRYIYIYIYIYIYSTLTPTGHSLLQPQTTTPWIHSHWALHRRRDPRWQSLWGPQPQPLQRKQCMGTPKNRDETLRLDVPATSPVLNGTPSVNSDKLRTLSSNGLTKGLPLWSWTEMITQPRPLDDLITLITILNVILTLPTPSQKKYLTPSSKCIIVTVLTRIPLTISFHRILVRPVSIYCPKYTSQATRAAPSHCVG